MSENRLRDRRIHLFDPGSAKLAQTIPADEFCTCSRHRSSPIHKTSRTDIDRAAQFTADNADADLVASVNRFRSYISGRSVRILTDHNDQPYGSSKKSLKGKVETVRDAGWGPNGLYLMLTGRRCSISVHDVEFIS